MNHQPQGWRWPADSEHLLQMAENLHYEVVAANCPHWDRLGRNDWQEAFRAEATKRGIENKTWPMGYVVAKCMAMSGFGG